MNKAAFLNLGWLYDTGYKNNAVTKDRSLFPLHVNKSMQVGSP